MPWGRFSDKIHRWREVRTLRRMRGGMEAFGTWSYWLSWCLDDPDLTGVVPSIELGSTEEKLAERLVEVGLWERTEDGFYIVHWPEIAPTSAQVEAKRKADRERVASKRNATRENVARDNAATRDGVASTRDPNPSQLDPNPDPPLPPTGGSSVPLSGAHQQETRDVLAAEATAAGLKAPPTLTHTRLRQVVERIALYAGSSGKPFHEACRELVRAGVSKAKAHGQSVANALLEAEPGTTYEPRDWGPKSAPRRTSKQVRAESQAALIRGDSVEVIRKLNAEARELEDAEERAARGFRARA